MTKSKFTPRSWHVEDNGLCVCDSNRVVLFLSDRPYGDETDRADTRLIAAAPDMYAFLEKLVNQIEENGLMQYDAIHNGENWVLEEAKELLSKACGESEVGE